MSENSEITIFIKDLCTEHSLKLESASDGNFRIFTDSASGITLFLEIKSSTDFSFHFLQRTHDIFYNGDRTDVHVVLSLMFGYLFFVLIFD